ncbi:MAG: T9SS type A sorting domain-containing protein [Ignavibacteriales bacterium]|nr:T9SS type A sorting domain-containing protein [Ignavibacteriales bacterium]
MKNKILLFNLIAAIFIFQIQTFGQDYWRASSGPFSTATNSVVVAPNGHIFAGTNQGMYRSTDDGFTWVLTNLTNVVWSVAVTTNGVLFAGTSDNGVNRSTDDGATWISVSLVTYKIYYVNVASDGFIYYANSQGELYQSSDNGDTWIRKCYTVPPSQMWAFTKNQAGHLFIGTYNFGIFRSTDSGTSWTQLKNGLPDTTIWALAYNKSGHIFAGTSHGGAYRSLDNGNSWAQINNGLNAITIWSLAINADGNIFAGTPGNGVFRSTDNGNSWANISTGLSDSSIYFLSIDKNEYLWAGTQNGVFKSVNPTGSPNNINLSTNITFGDPTKNSSYQMVGLPGDVNLPLAQMITGTAGTDWTAYWDNGAVQGNYFINYDGTNTFNFQPGRAFWLLSKNTITINKQVTKVSLTDNYYSIPLHSGWNLISHPFFTITTWQQVQTLNPTVSQPIYSFSNGNYTQATNLEPYKGYYFINSGNLSSLKIPFNTGIIPNGAASPNIYAKRATTNSLRLVLSSSSKVEKAAEINFIEKCKNGLDAYDIFAPPGNFEEQNITIYNDELSTSYKQLLVDSRQEVGEGQQFEIKIKNETKKPATLSIEGVAYFNEYEVLLMDIKQNRFYNLKEINQVELLPNLVNCEFSLFIGKENFIQEKIKQLQPTRFQLFQNFPNPFNPTTTITYTIPNTETGNKIVQLKVYDVIGNEIAILVNESKPAGKYEVHFDGSSLSSGIYYYVLRFGENRLYGKMSLIK